MPVAGAKPKADRSQVRHRIEPVHEWTEVENVPYAGAPKLRDRATGGISVMAVGAENSSDWPQATLDWWRDVSTMPHAKLWDAGEWRFAMDSAEIHARTMEGWRGYTGPTLLAREKVLGMHMVQPFTEIDEAAWRQLIGVLDEEHRLLREVIATLSDADLRDKKKQRLVYGVAAHDVYHAGQIRLVKRLRDS